VKLVVLTGCAGFMGSYAARACLEKGWKVLGVDKFTYAASRGVVEELRKHENFSFWEEDICELKHLPDCDYVINTAAETHVGNSILDSSAFIHSNIEGVKNLLDLIRAKPSSVREPPTLLHFSTDEVYGDIEKGEHIEDDLLNPSNPYSASKASADMLIKAWSRTYGVEYNILRPTNNYGIGQYPEKLIPLTVKLLMCGKRVRLHEAGTPIRNWLHAADTAAAVVRIVESGVKNEIFNVAGGFEQPNWLTVKKIINIYYNEEDDERWKEYVDFHHSRPGQDVRYALNDDKLRGLGWKPEKSFDKEIGQIVEYYSNNFKW